MRCQERFKVLVGRAESTLMLLTIWDFAPVFKHCLNDLYLIFVKSANFDGLETKFHFMWKRKLGQG